MTATPGQAERILPAYGAVGERELSEAVHQALGAASVCWEPMDCTGVFESSRAAQIGAELMGIIGQYADAAAQEPHAADGEVATPAVTRPSYGDVLVLAVGEDFPAERAQQLQDMLAGLNQGVAVTTVRGVEALRAWQPQPAPELAAAMDAPAALARVLSWFEQFGTRRTAIATRAQLAHAYQDGGLTVPEELRRFL